MAHVPIFDSEWGRAILFRGGAERILWAIVLLGEIINLNPDCTVGVQDFEPVRLGIKTKSKQTKKGCRGKLRVGVADIMNCQCL